MRACTPPPYSPPLVSRTKRSPMSGKTPPSYQDVAYIHRSRSDHPQVRLCDHYRRLRGAPPCNAARSGRPKLADEKATPEITFTGSIHAAPTHKPKASDETDLPTSLRARIHSKRAPNRTRLHSTHPRCCSLLIQRSCRFCSPLSGVRHVK